MKRNLILFAMLFPLFSLAQTDTLFIKKFRHGIGFSAGVGIWNQQNLNTVLNNNNIPKVPDFSIGGSVEAIYQWNKFRMLLSVNSNSSAIAKRSENIFQNFSGLELGGNYAVVRNKSIRLAPNVGVGFLSGYTKIRKDVLNQSYQNLFFNRNTVEMFNSQGYINLGLSLGFCYSPYMKEHLFEVSSGYKLGFGASDWSTDEQRQNNQNGISDEISQYYLKFKINFLRNRKMHFNYWEK